MRSSRQQKNKWETITKSHRPDVFPCCTLAKDNSHTLKEGQCPRNICMQQGLKCSQGGRIVRLEIGDSAAAITTLTTLTEQCGRPEPRSRRNVQGNNTYVQHPRTSIELEPRSGRNVQGAPPKHIAMRKQKRLDPASAHCQSAHTNRRHETNYP